MRGNVYIIGCGGVGSWLTPSVALLIGAERLRLIDGDKLEEKNLNRQLFSTSDLGKFKAESLAIRYKLPPFSYLNEWYAAGKIDHDPEDMLVSCVDNNAARMAVLMECDRCNCCAIIAANETFSSEAYYYRPEWSGTGLDPRVFYPDIKEERGNDPARRSAGCTGAIQQENPQLVSANYMAGGLAQHLFVFWFMEFPKNQWTEAQMGNLPFHYRANMTRMESILIKDRLPVQTLSAGV